MNQRVESSGLFAATICVKYGAFKIRGVDGQDYSASLSVLQTCTNQSNRMVNLGDRISNGKPCAPVRSLVQFILLFQSGGDVVNRVDR